MFCFVDIVVQKWSDDVGTFVWSDDVGSFVWSDDVLTFVWSDDVGTFVRGRNGMLFSTRSPTSKE